ncbi:MAG: patatin-like phospholipase family protein [Bacteroidota bacterium]
MKQNSTIPNVLPRPINQSVGLALGGGGMKGWAHLGVISVLEEEGLRPNMIAGSSAGALIGAYYAFGYSFEDMLRFMREQRTMSLFSLRFDGLGLLNNEALREYLYRHFGDATFDDLEIPFFVICTDIETGREVVLQRGSVVEAILASSAMPGIFAPVSIDGHILVDGGLCNNVPVSVLVAHGARYTVAVRLHNDASGIDARPIRRTSEENEMTWMTISGWADRLKRSIIRDGSRLPNGMEVLGRAMEIVVSRLESYRLQAYPPDVLISPDVSHISTLKFSEGKDDIFMCGERAARAQSDRLRKLGSLLQQA